VRLNHEVLVYRGVARTRPEMTGFTGQVLEMAFSRQAAVKSLGADAVPGTYNVTLSGVFTDGTRFTSTTAIVLDGATAKVDSDGGSQTLPSEFSLGNAYPNPFNPTTTIDFALPRACHVTLNAYNVTGQRVARLVDRTLDAGWHEVEWNGTNDDGQSVATGVYFYRLSAQEFTETKEMVLLK